MESVKDNLQTLSRAILKKAHADAEEVLADAKAKAEAIRNQAQEQAESERSRILARAQQEVDRIHSQQKATAELQARSQKLEQREALLDQVFEAVRQRLPSVQQWTDYDQITMQLAREALTQLRADQGILYADARTQEVLDDAALEQLGKAVEMEVKRGETLAHGTGVVAKTEDDYREYDNTLEARLDREQDELRFPVFRLLMGESL
ncbi:MAG: V-type ATP synthase subunit E [Anaerolineae bacterium]|jgi:V/A-type H+-transporting ATPase subunit E